MNRNTAVFFGLGAFGKDVMYAMSTIMNIFMIGYLGMNPAWIGLMFMVVRLWDAINDPIMGTIVQNTKSKFGKFRPWILIGSILNAVILIFVYYNPGMESESVGLFVYMTIFYTLWGMSYTLMDIPFWSMLPTFSKDQRVREKYTAVARIGAQIGFAVISAGALAMAAGLGGGSTNEAMIDGFFKLAVGVSVLFVVTQVLVFVFVKDEYSSSSDESMSLRQMFKYLRENDQLMVVGGVIVLFNSVLYITSAMAFYYLRYDIGTVNFFGTEMDYTMFNMVFLAIGFLVQLIAMGSYQIYAKRMKRKQVFELGIVITIVGYLVLLLNSFILGNLVLILLLGAMIVFYGLGLLIIAQTVLLADTVDYGEWKNGIRSESAVFSIQTFIVKMATGISMGIVGVGLSLIGFDTDLEIQSTLTISGFRIMMFVLPIGVILAALLLFRRKHRLDEELYAQVISELESR